MKQLRYITTILLIITSLIIFNGAISKSPSHEPIDIRNIEIIPSPYEELVNKYNTFIKAEIDTTGNVGAAVAIVCGNSLVFIKPYGVKKTGTNDSVDIHTVFRMASVSKGFAGVLAAKLEHENRINLNDKVIEYLPGFRLKDSVNERELSIRNTLNHTSGLTPHAYDNLIEANIPMRDIISQLKDVDICDTPGKVYGYQNALYSLIDTILVIKTQKSYSQLLCDELFQPLGMNDASSDFKSIEEGNNIALPHAYAKSGPISLKPNNRYYNMAPAAGVNASISDMSKWLQALLGQNPLVIDAYVQHAISTPTVQTPLKRHYTSRWHGVEEKYYSLGWRIFTFRGYNIVYHGGYVKGYRAEIAFCPELDAGIVFLQNSPNKLSSESVPMFWEMYFDAFVADSTKS
jgi:beta-lactamase class C